MSDLKSVASHLKRLGYEIEEEEHFVRAAHENHPVILARGFEAGVMLVTAFRVSKDNAEPATLYFVNDLNLQAIAARFVVDKDGDFTMEAWMPSPYDPQIFTNLFARWQSDLAMVLHHDQAKGVLAN
jgi:hypothetical protein